MSEIGDARSALQELSAFVQLASTDPSHAPTMSDDARMSLINSIAPFLDAALDDFLAEEKWILETVDLLDEAAIGEFGDASRFERVLRERIHLLRQRSEHVR